MQAYLKQLAKETSVPSYLSMPNPKHDRVQFHLLAEQQRIHREMLERRGKELLELEITGDSPDVCDDAPGIKYPYKAVNCMDGHQHNIHTHGQQLQVGKVYNLRFANHHHSGCHTITGVHEHEGLHVDVLSGPHADCGECAA